MINETQVATKRIRKIEISTSLSMLYARKACLGQSEPESMPRTRKLGKPSRKFGVIKIR